jgi:hypothetical protein
VYEGVSDRVHQLATAAGIGDVTLLSSAALGRRCAAALGAAGNGTRPTIVFGEALLQTERGDIRDFLIYRSVKSLQTRTSALARTAPVDLGPLLAAYLRLHQPDFIPSGVDPGKLDIFSKRMVEAGGVARDARYAALASEVIASIGNRASSLSTAAHAWGSRTALLATGDPHVAIEAAAWGSGDEAGPPEQGADRIKWIGRHAEARDFIVFSVSDAYHSLRSRLG